MNTKPNELQRLLAEIDSLMASAAASGLIRDARNCAEHARKVAAKAIKLLQEQPSTTQDLDRLDKQCRDDVARALGLTPHRDGYAWSALLADIKTAAKVAQAGLTLEGWKLGPFNPTEDQWGGLARAIVFWMRSYPSNKHTPSTLVEFITSLGHEVPAWMGDEVELRAQDHVISKGTVAVLIYKAMLDAAPQPASEVPQAWLDVQAERRRQIEAEGWTLEHDDQHQPGELAQAAVAYLLYAYPRGNSDLKFATRLWPWLSGFKPKGERRDLVRGAALGLAALERFDRAAASAQGGE